MTYNIGIITYDARSLPATYRLDDYLLKEALTRRGVKATIFSWTNPHIDLTAFDALVLRSCWDSHYDPPAFINWLERAETGQSRLINPYPVVLWCYHKERYMTDLAVALRQHPSPKGQIVPSVFYSNQSSNSEYFQPTRGNSLANILAELDTQAPATWQGQDIVIKPTISASSHNTLRIVRTPANQVLNTEDVLSMNKAETWFDRLLQQETCSGVIIQPLIAGIKNGEYSLIYISGEFSHAVHKTVDDQDFKSRLETNRVGIHPEALPAGMRAFADQMMALVQVKFPSETITYARIDLIQEIDGKPILLECELEAPSLQFVRLPEIYYSNRHRPTQAEIEQGQVMLDVAIDRFAEAIIAQADRVKAN